ncbi:MAG: VWA domain-containing protein, partial [Gammaproteobacteria bacterium]
MIGGIDLTQLHWAHPYGWLLALQPALMAMLARLRGSKAQRYADRRLLPWAVWQGRTPAGRGRTAVNLLAWVLLGCAAAGPRVALDAGTSPGARGPAAHGMDVMVVLDVGAQHPSGGGRAGPLERARLQLLDLLPQLQGERLGLVVYGHGAGLLMPLNRDYHAFRYYLGLAQPTLFKGTDTDLAGALTLARKTLQSRTSPSQAVLLLTAGLPHDVSGPAGSALPAAVAALRSAHVPLYILDTARSARPSAAVLARDAALTGGTLVRAGGRDVWKTLYHDGIRTLPGSGIPTSSASAWRPLFGWFLAPALVLLWMLYLPVEIGVRRTGGAALLLCCLLLAGMATPRAAAAAGATAARAYAAYHAGKFALAQAMYAQLPGYAARMGEGASAYRLKAYPYAIRQFTAALLHAGSDKQRADALYDLGNSEYRAGHYRAAADAYLGVLRYRPDARARANLALAANQLGGLVRTGKYTLGILALRGQSHGHKPGDGSGTGGASAPGKPSSKPLPLTALHPQRGDYARARPSDSILQLEPLVRIVIFYFRTPNLTEE